MTWKSHIAIATAITIPFNPALIVASAVGSTAPDWSEWILKFFGVRVQHRGATHYFYIPILIIAFSFIFDFKNIIFWFGIGYFTHWFADALTRSGVPISQWDNNRVHFFGGKFRTGEPIEYIIAFGLLFFVLLIVNPNLNKLIGDNTEDNFNVYYMDYQELYDKNIIDERTYKERRFKLF
jgi:inner membrane protein